MNVLVMAPHPDDEVIGCGGALCLHARRGDRISAVFLTSGELGLKKRPREEAWKIREAEARRAAKILGLSALHFLRQPDWTLGEHVTAAAAALYPILQQQKPGLIYLPHPQEWHPDHQAALAIVRRALRRGGMAPPKLRGYEVWTPMSRFDEVEHISAVMARKLRALRAHRSQLAEFDYVQAVRGLNQFRGALAARTRFGEVFQLLKM
ncbi:MAG: PIG-L family deacetylase [Verrucomicrobiota bacterium]|nr:PIG-L family deacetylase [Verrucomicrobiota bacterium]